MTVPSHRCRLALLLPMAMITAACNQEQPRTAARLPVVQAARLSATVRDRTTHQEPPPSSAQNDPLMALQQSGSRTSIAPDIKPRALLDLRRVAPYAALDFPKMVRATEAGFLGDREYVLGITGGGESRAYPLRFMAFHHVINDKIGTAKGEGTPVAITHCIVCGTGILYDPVVNGKVLKLDFYGLYNGTVALCERSTKGVFLPSEGRIVSGPLLGTHLKPGSMLETTWGQWKKLHPNTLVMSPETPYKKFYSTREQPVERRASQFPMPIFGMTLCRTDTRLSLFETVLAITLTPTEKQRTSPLHRAYPLKTLQREGNVVNDTLGNTPIGVLLDPKTLAATAVLRQLGSRTLTLKAQKQADGGIAFYDRETGTRWNIEGIGLVGPLAGKALPHLDNHLSQWYGWAAAFPDTSIYGRDDPPQSVEISE